jgi:CheY-like chemotaxis protein
MARIRLLHWKKPEAAAYLKALTRAGHRVEHDEQFRPALLKQWRESPPDAFVIDLSRLPSQGREIAIALRQSPGTRSTPIVFCAGDPAKVSALREILPDAAYCEFDTLLSTLKQALSSPPKNPVRPTAMMDRYKSRTAAEKLGIKEGGCAAVINPPRAVDRVLGDLPSDARLVETETPEPKAQVHLCFVDRPDELGPLVSRFRSCADHSKLWILWRKGGKAAAGDVTEALVRNQALDLGLVDYKICSVNEVWTGMLFALKR